MARVPTFSSTGERNIQPTSPDQRGTQQLTRQVTPNRSEPDQRPHQCRRRYPHYLRRRRPTLYIFGTITYSYGAENSIEIRNSIRDDPMLRLLLRFIRLQDHYPPQLELDFADPYYLIASTQEGNTVTNQYLSVATNPSTGSCTLLHHAISVTQLPSRPLFAQRSTFALEEVVYSPEELVEEITN